MSEEIKKLDSDNEFRSQGDLIDDSLQQELDDALGGKSIDELMNEELAAGSQPEKTADPSICKGTVASIEGDEILVELDEKSQGILQANQFEGDLPNVGDQIEFTKDRFDKREGMWILNRQGAIIAASWDSLQAGQNVEALVTGQNKGGLEVTVNKIKAFMPISQVERFGGVEDLEQYLNQKLQCQVMEVDRANNKVVLSRKQYLNQLAAAARDELLQNIEQGQTVTGTVKSIMPYGAFVDIGGVDGLLHVREMSHSRVDKPEDVVKVGQEVKVVVINVDKENNKIGLSLKQATPDPWSDVENRFPVNQQVTGHITKLMDFGAFVQLTEGVEGLIPMSEFRYGKRIAHPSEVVTEGQVVKVTILNVDAAKKRISLSLKRTGEDPWLGAQNRWAVDSIVEGKVSRIADFGAFIELTEGVEGLIHISELSEQRVKTVGDVVRDGEMVKAKVLEVDEERKRISLSIKKLSEPDNTIPENMLTKTSAETGDTEIQTPKSDSNRKGGITIKGDNGIALEDLLKKFGK